MPEKVVISAIFPLTGFLPVGVTAQESAKEQISQPFCRYCPNPEFPGLQKTVLLLV